MFTGNLKGHRELIFRQSVYGSLGHIVVNVGDWEESLLHPSLRLHFRVDTLCGKNLKYNDRHSGMEGRDGVVRNACADCFLQADYSEPFQLPSHILEGPLRKDYPRPETETKDSNSSNSDDDREIPF